MSKKKMTVQNKSDESNPADNPSYLKQNWLMILIICTASLGVLGSGLSYLEQDAQKETAKRNASTPLNPVKDESMLNSVNPFLPAPTPAPTPQLSKEYIYAGSRLLAIEDANASAAPPADLAVWRPSSGVWWVMGGQGSQQIGFAWGTNGDKAVPGDYDGDGKTDFSIFRPASSTWWIMKSSDNTFYSVPFGASGDQIAQADYDGDGKTDAAVFRPSNGTWYVQNTPSGFSSQAFGLASDVPAPADYDGDGKADITVWRSSGTTFYSLNSTNSQLASAVFTATSSEPVSADYDGDGRADHAIRNANNWIIRKSSNNQTEIVAWHQATDKAVHNDYDGDGKVDIAVWREANGNWYIRKSGSGGALRQQAWGQSGDIPVPAFYRR